MIAISMFVVLTYNENVDDCVWFQCSWWYRTIEDSRAGCLFCCRVNFGNCSRDRGPSHI